VIQYGDRHNFGQQVKPIERASGTWFQKPRSVFWEHLFFGKNSPLKEYFSLVGENGYAPLSSYFFNLEVEIQNVWLGFSRKIVTQPESLKNTEKFYGFGALLAYCYAFGIQDLHRFNVIETSSHLQVIDAEVVLSKLTLPNETLLLPFKSVNFSVAAIGILASSYESLTTEQAKALFAGYYDICGILLRHANEVKTEMMSAIPAETPIRVILRNTSAYSEMLATRNFPDDLLYEEKEQLERTDVPYFFKTAGDSRIYWMQQPGDNGVPVKNSGPFAKDFLRFGLQPNNLLPNGDQLEMKIYQGALFLLKQMRFADDFDLYFRGEKLIVNKNSINIADKNRTYSYR
jgi:lantibiotic modifying enzyme